MLPLPHGHRTLRVQAVVRAYRAPGQGGPGGRGARPHRHPAGNVDQDLLRLAGQHPRLVHLPPDLVGASHPGLDLRRLRQARGHPGGPHGLPGLRRHAHPRSRRARHLVFLGPVAVFHPGLARPDPGTQDVLSDVGLKHRV